MTQEQHHDLNTTIKHDGEMIISSSFTEKEIREILELPAVKDWLHSKYDIFEGEKFTMYRWGENIEVDINEFYYF